MIRGKKFSDIWKAVDLQPATNVASDHMIQAELKVITGEVQALRTQIGELKSLLWGSLKNSDPLDLYVISHQHFFHEGHFHEHYDDWRMRRIRKVMEIYGSDFRGKRVLELGGGLGDIGAFFASLGAEVLSLEGRKVNQQFASIKYRNLKTFKSVLCDLEKDFSSYGRFDLIINFGLLEVIENLDNLMECCCRMSDCIFLETLVCDSTDPSEVRYIKMDPAQTIDNPLYGPCAQPSPFYIEKFFETRGYSFRRAFDKDLNSVYHIYDWQHDNNTVDRPPYKRRFWLFSKNEGNV